MMIITTKDVNKIKQQRIERFWELTDNVGRINLSPRIRLGPYDKILNAWKNQPAFVVGSSMAARGFNLALLDGLNSIGVNHMIEHYDRFKWFLFMDQRFLRLTTYDLSKYQGVVFAYNRANIEPRDVNRLVYFKCKPIQTEPDMNIESGLYCRNLSGMVALHLAIIAGASPIFMLGMDNKADINPENGFHYTENYNGEEKSKKSFDGYTKISAYFKKFNKWADKIINVCPEGQIDCFKKISLLQLENYIKELKK